MNSNLADLEAYVAELDEALCEAEDRGDEAYAQRLRERLAELAPVWDAVKEVA